MHVSIADIILVVVEVDMNPHWADQYRDSPSNTLEWWIYVAASCCRGTEDRIRAVGEYAFKHGCGVWHAGWELGNQQNPCYCAPCCNARGV